MAAEDDYLWPDEPQIDNQSEESFDDPKIIRRNHVVANIDNNNPRKYCWADLVRWANAPYGVQDAIKKSETCQGEETCYCGAWANGKLLAHRTREERKRDRVVQRLLSGDENDELPF